jgi:hypothetical protein
VCEVRNSVLFLTLGRGKLGARTFRILDGLLFVEGELGCADVVCAVFCTMLKVLRVRGPAIVYAVFFPLFTAVVIEVWKWLFLAWIRKIGLW